MRDLVKYRKKAPSLFACFGKESKSRDDLHRKMVIVGDGACGKTCLVTRMTKGQFVDIGYIPTVFDTEVVNVSVDNQDVELGIFDTAGQEEYDRLRPLSYHDVDIALICFSLDDQDTLINVEENWSPEIRYFCGQVPVILVGNKVDLRDRNIDTSRHSQDVFYMHPTCQDKVSDDSFTHSSKSKTDSSISEDADTTESDDGSLTSVGSKSGSGSINLTPDSSFLGGDTTIYECLSYRRVLHPGKTFKEQDNISALFAEEFCNNKQTEKTTCVSRARGVSVAKRIGAIAYFETSALTGSNVIELLTATASAAVLGNKKAKKCKSLTKTLSEREPMPNSSPG